MAGDHCYRPRIIFNADYWQIGQRKIVPHPRDLVSALDMVSQYDLNRDCLARSVRKVDSVSKYRKLTILPPPKKKETGRFVNRLALNVLKM